MTDRRHLHLVYRPPPAPRIAVRLTAFASRGGPYGRSLAFRLTEHDIEELLRCAERLEMGVRR